MFILRLHLLHLHSSFRLRRGKKNCLPSKSLISPLNSSATLTHTDIKVISSKFVGAALQGGVWEHGGGNFFVCFGKFWHPGNPLFTLACLLFDYEPSWGKHYLLSARAGLASCHNTNEDACTPPECLGLTRSRRHCMQPRRSPLTPPHLTHRQLWYELAGSRLFQCDGSSRPLRNAQDLIPLQPERSSPLSAPTASTLSCKTKNK